MNNKTTTDNNWLQSYAYNKTSQHGEDGIIEKVLEVIGDNDKWCVEFGSWDGKRASNTYTLITDKYYSAVLIEASSKRFQDLKKTFEGNNKVVMLNQFVGFGDDDNLDKILEKTPIPQNFDLLSIDVDGNDYHIWHAVRKYRPKCAVIEFNPTIPKEVEFVQGKDHAITQGCSLLSLTKLARSKGYELVATTKGNAIYVDKKYFDKFGIADNSVAVMWTDQSFITYIFCGFDGKIFIRGYGKSPWHLFPFKESKVQMLPKWAVKRVGDKNFIRRKLGKFYRRLVKEK
ncbi:MAG: FkbM family methyltransferase [Sedimentisphaerales bacterium]|nr:FkbM family methyltransferase [Sedimentisphaerales bacterium]